jgi:hypothetical protein
MMPASARELVDRKQVVLRKLFLMGGCKTVKRTVEIYLQQKPPSNGWCHVTEVVFLRSRGPGMGRSCSLPHQSHIDIHVLL